MQKIINILNNSLYPISLYARQIAGTIVLFVIARYLSVYDYGVFSSYKAICGFILTLACLGYNEYILVSSKKNLENVSQKITLFLSNAFIILFCASLISVFFPLELHLIFILVLLRTFFDTTFFALILPYFQASNSLNTIAKINIVYSLLVAFITTLSYIFKLSLLNFLILSCIIGLINFIHCTKYTNTKYIDFIKQPFFYLKLLDKSILGYIGVIIAFLLYSQIPSLYVSTYLAKEQAALYFSAFTIASIIGLLIMAQNQKILPEMIISSVEKVRQLIKKNFIFIMSINTFLFCVFLFCGKILLKLIYGQDYYSNGYILLLIFTIGNVFLALANIYGAYITASGNQHAKIPRQIEAIFISILSLFVFQKLGVYAPALAYLLSSTYVGLRYTLFTLKLLKEKEST